MRLSSGEDATEGSWRKVIAEVMSSSRGAIISTRSSELSQRGGEISCGVSIAKKSFEQRTLTEDHDRFMLIISVRALPLDLVFGNQAAPSFQV